MGTMVYSLKGPDTSYSRVFGTKSHTHGLLGPQRFLAMDGAGVYYQPNHAAPSKDEVLNPGFRG